MATVNPTLQLMSILPAEHRFRGKVLEVDEPANQARIEWGSSYVWVTTSITLAINDHVIVKGTAIEAKVPDLPHQRIEIS